MSLKRQYTSNAEKQRAYRQRKNVKSLLDNDFTAEEAAKLLDDILRRFHAQGSERAKCLLGATPAQTLTRVAVWFDFQDAMFLDGGNIWPPEVLERVAQLLAQAHDPTLDFSKPLDE